MCTGWSNCTVSVLMCLLAGDGKRLGAKLGHSPWICAAGEIFAFSYTTHTHTHTGQDISLVPLPSVHHCWWSWPRARPNECPTGMPHIVYCAAPFSGTVHTTTCVFPVHCFLFHLIDVGRGTPAYNFSPLMPPTLLAAVTLTSLLVASQPPTLHN